LHSAAEQGSGFLSYADPTGRRLANQGWKDSGDAIRYADGRLAQPPVALSEVQGYAHEAALGGAALLEAFDRPGAASWRAWAADLRARFRAAFWVADSRGPYPALALDGRGLPVDAVASNMGHLLATGILNVDEAEIVARRLAGPDMAGAYGLRTMSEAMRGYSTFSYHCGSVWPHDTAITIAALAATGHGGSAGELLEGLLQAGAAFEGRLPELWSGDARTDVPRPVPYPAACRPQAWAAAAGVALVAAVLGLRPDVPGGVLRVRPMTPSPVGPLRVEGLRVAGVPLEVDAGSEGVRVRTPAPLTIIS
jgi:glycogen debranching enzyme